MKNTNTLINYLKDNKDKTFDELKWNILDNALCSLLVYGNIKTNDDLIIDDFINKIIDTYLNINYGALMSEVVKICLLIKGSIRYKNILVKHYIYLIDDNTQFGAMAFTINKKAIISFAGSDGAVIGWYENLRCAYKFPIYTQIKAQEYLSNIIDEYDEVTVLGHSKGGNLAIASALGLKDYQINKIKNIYNFDGQGFFDSVIKSNEYKLIENRIINFIPTSSYVGTLLYQGGKTLLVKAITRGIGVHFPFNWAINGNDFVQGNKLLKSSERIHEITTKGLDNVDKKDLEETFEKIILVMPLERKNKLKLKKEDVFSIIKTNHTNKTITLKQIKVLFDLFFYRGE